jgi:hypothetical protein
MTDMIQMQQTHHSWDHQEGSQFGQYDGSPGLGPQFGQYDGGTEPGRQDGGPELSQHNNPRTLHPEHKPSEWRFCTRSVSG